MKMEKRRASERERERGEGLARERLNYGYYRL